MINPRIDLLLAASAGLVAIVGAKIYRTQADETVAAPYVVWSIISGSPENNLSDLPEVDEGRIQVDCYSLSQSEARRMCDYCVTAIESSFHIIFGPVESREDDTKLWRWSFDLTSFTNR